MKKEDIIQGYHETFIDATEVMCERDCFWFEERYDN